MAGFDNVGAFIFGAQVAEVAVDPTTGKVEVVEAWCAHDVGGAINPGGVVGQIEGGFVQGLGYALTGGRRRRAAGPSPSRLNLGVPRGIGVEAL